jgi:hypothetical protein
MIVGGLEGAMLVARPLGDITWFQNAAGHLLAGLRSTPARADRPRSTSKPASALRGS